MNDVFSVVRPSMYEINYGIFNVGFENQIPYQQFFEHKSFQIISSYYLLSERLSAIYIFGERSFPVHVERLKYYLSDPLPRSARRSSSSHFLKSN